MTSFALSTFLTLFVTLDPVGVSPVFVSVAGDRQPDEQRLIARKAVAAAGAILVGFGLVERPLFQYIGVSVAALRVVGGVVLFKVAFEMITAVRKRRTKAESREAEERDDVSIFPLAIPVVAGPGSIAIIMVLVADNPGDASRTGVVFAALVSVLLFVWLSFRVSAEISRVLEETGINVVSRVLGIVLAALAVQMITDGVLGLL